MLKKTVLSALLLGAAVFAASPSQAAGGWRHPGFHPHERFVFRHDFRHFSPIEHRWWVGGRWHHMWWHGRFGWWWGVGGAFYWYPGPVYPYPAEVSSTYYDDDGYDDQGGDQDGDQAAPGGPGGGYGTWYHCSRPEGYYPYIQSCKGGWESVPAQPNDMQGGPQGGPNDGPPPGGDQYNNGDQPPPPPPH